MIGSPSTSKINRSGMGKNRSDLTGGIGINATVKSSFSKAEVFGKAQSNISNKSTRKGLEHAISKLSIGNPEAGRPLKGGKYKLEKFLCKESNRSAVFSFTKGQNPSVLNLTPFTPTYKEKSFAACKFSRVSRCNSPQVQQEQMKKGFYGSYTSSTLQTVSMAHSESANLFQVRSPSCARLCNSRLVAYDVAGVVQYISHFDDRYGEDIDDTRQEQRSAKVSDMMLRCLRGHAVIEKNESMFFQPKASVISVGRTDIDTCGSRLEILHSESQASNNQDNNELEYYLRGDELPNHQIAYTDELSDTSTFIPVGLDSRTLGRKTSKLIKVNDDDYPLNVLSQKGMPSPSSSPYKRDFWIDESRVASLIDNGDQKTISHRGISEVKLKLDGYEQKEFLNRNKDLEMHFQHNLVHTLICDNLTENHYKVGDPLVPPICNGHIITVDSYIDPQDSAEDSERYNLYRHIQTSDSEDQELDLSGRNSQSEGSFEKGRLYGQSPSQSEVDSHHLFSDDELRSKYQSLLQHN